MDNPDQADEYSGESLRDDASSIEILSEGGESTARELDWSMFSAGRSLAGSSMSSLDFQKMTIHPKMKTIIHQDGEQFIERRNSDLPYSAEFRLGGEMWKLSGDEQLLTCGTRYIASVRVDGEVNLENALDFNEAIHLLLRHLKVEKVFIDALLEEYKKAKDVVKLLLEKLAHVSDENRVFELFKLWKLLGDRDSVLNPNIMLSVENCPDISNEMIAAINCCVTKGLQLFLRIEILDPANKSPRATEFIENAIHEAVRTRRNQIAAICPPIMKNKLMDLNNKHILCITKGDIELFDDLTTLDQSMFGTALPKLVNKFLEKVQLIGNDQQSALSSRMLFFVCKSLQETANEHNVQVHYGDEHGWNITQPPKESQSPYDQCLQMQLQMLVRLANHFEPGGPFLENNFPYEFQLFQNVESIPEEVRIWLCLLDDSMKGSIEADFDKMKMFSFLFKSYVSFIRSEHFRSETLESLRKITQETLRTLAEMKQASSQERVNTDTIVPKYDEMISNCLRSVPVEYFKNDCDKILTTLRYIISYVKMTSDESTALSKTFEDLLSDMTDLEFEWFIRLPASDERDLLLRRQFIVPVDNRRKDTEHQCLQVTDQKGFIKVYRVLNDGSELPKHYQLNVIRELLQQVEKITTKKTWQGGKRLSRNDRLEAMAALVTSIRKSILHFREQPEYATFEDFQQKTLAPVVIAVEQSSSLEDFRNRLALNRNLRTTSVPNIGTNDIQEAMLFIDNTSYGCLIKQAFSRYSTVFEQRILQYNGDTRMNTILKISNDVLLSKTLMPDQWMAEFTLATLPDTLASLSAVWSLIVSKDVSSLESLVKPTCLQICYVLQYLLIEAKLYFMENQLIQLSATQGKMLVLGLITALFAVFGYEVGIVCYNSSLFRRNATDILKLFEMFSVESKISFGTIEDFAREQSEAVYHKYAKYLHQCLDIPFTDKPKRQSENSSESVKSVLIIDGIDIFHLEENMDFMRYVMPIIPGLAIIQEKIYSSDKKFTIQEIVEFIEKSDLLQMGELRAFLNKPKTYTFIELFSDKEWSNKTLFLEALNKMIRYKHLPTDRYRLTSEGKLKARRLHESHVATYTTVAAYFQLKKSNFQQIVDDQITYGCLQNFLVPFPYKNLLSGFSLGFQSTCYLDQYKNHSESPFRSWRKSLACPRDLCPTKFDSTQDFLCVTSEVEWMISIMTAIHTAIERHESVLVFFESEIELHRFQKEFASQLKRFIVTAIETSSNGKGSSKGQPVLLDEVSILVIDEVDTITEERDTHVIQTFWSKQAREEHLIKQQAERKHSNGSYELILCLLQVCQQFHEDVKAGSYDLLTYLRNRHIVPEDMTIDLYSGFYKRIEVMCEALIF